MTLETTNVKNVYAGDGVTIHWGYTFDIITATDVLVMITSAIGIHTVLDSNYTVDTLNSRVIYPNSGTPLAADGSTITVYRSRPKVQETSFSDSGPFPASAFQRILDSLTMMVQELADEMSRAIRYTIDQTPTEEETTAIIESSAAAAASATAAAASAVAAAASAAGLVPVPVGGGMDWFIDALPGPNWHLRDGGAVSRVDCAILFGMLGTKYGSGDGHSTFNLPNDTNRVNIGAGDLYDVGDTGGEATHVLTTTEIPAHPHAVTVTDPGHPHPVSDPGHPHTQKVTLVGGGTTKGYVSSNFDGSTTNANVTTAPSTTGVTVSSNTTGITAAATNTGGGGAHNNLPPYLGTYKIIRIY